MPSYPAASILLPLVLFLVALHSAVVGLTLMAGPKRLLHWAGFQADTEPFFAAQAGVFHLVLAVGYTMAALGHPNTESLVLFSILVKGMAAIFLLGYFLLKDRKWVILLSGAADGCMGAAIWLASLNTGL